MMEELLAQTPYCYQWSPMWSLAHASFDLGDLKKAEAWFGSSLERAVESGTLHAQADNLRWLSRIAEHRGDYDRAMALLERSQGLFRQVGFTNRLPLVSWQMSLAAWRHADFEDAARHAQRALDLAGRHGWGDEAALAHLVLALVACEQGAYDRAEALCAGALDDLPDDHPYGLGLASSALARVALSLGDPARAVDLSREALGCMRRHRRRPNIVEAAELLAWTLAADGHADAAARLLALAARERDAMGKILAPVDRPYHERAVCTVREALDEATFEESWALGEGLDLDEAIAFALPEETASDACTKVEPES